MIENRIKAKSYKVIYLSWVSTANVFDYSYPYLIRSKGKTRTGYEFVELSVQAHLALKMCH